MECILLGNVLEQLGYSNDIFIYSMKELYRMCEDSAFIHIVVPHESYDVMLTIQHTYVRLLGEEWVVLKRDE